MNITRYKARFAFLLGQLRTEIDHTPAGQTRDELTDSLIQLRFVSNQLTNHSQHTLDSYIEAAQAVIVISASARAFPKKVTA